MNGSGTRNNMGWGARLMVALVLVLIGAAAAVWALGRYQSAARFLGVTEPQPVLLTPKPIVTNPAPPPPPVVVEAQPARLSTLEARVAQVENATERAEGSAGRADALVIAFAARRAIDRGVALGYLERLLVSRFGPQHPRAR